MKNISHLLLLLTLFACNNGSAQKNVDANNFEKDLAKPGVQVLDVRTTGEFQNGYIQDAMLADWLNQEQFTDRVKYLDKNKPVLVYCASGGRSSKAADWLVKNGFTDVENLEGGFTQWKMQNKPVVGTSKVPQYTSDDYTKLVNSNKIVLVDFGAEWCPPCRKMQPIIEEVKTDMKSNISFTFVTVDGGIHTNVMKEQRVEAMPTFIVYKNGKEVWRKQGITDKATIEQQLK